MTAARFPQGQDCPTDPEMSSGKVLRQADASTVEGDAALITRGVPFDPYRYRALFPERWSAFLRAHHRNVEEVAVFYDVTFRTATNWWQGTHRPSGDKVAMAALARPSGFVKYLGAAA